MNQLWGEGGEGSCREDPGEGTGLSEDFCNFPSGCALLVLGGPAGIRLLGVPRGADGTPRWKVRPRIRPGEDREEVGAAWGAQLEVENWLVPGLRPGPPGPTRVPRPGAHLTLRLGAPRQKSSWQGTSDQS